jgi:hypothetical protein
MSWPSQHLRLRLWNVPILLDCGLDELQPLMRAGFGDAAHAEAAGKALRGAIHPFDSKAALANVSAAARSAGSNDPPLDVFVDGDRLWLVDDAWGLCEVDLGRQAWQSWMLPGAARDPGACLARGVMMPLACLLARRGLALVPAAAVARGSQASLILAPFPIHYELEELLRAGFRLIASDWTLLRTAGDGVEMLRVGSITSRDLSAEYCGTSQQRAMLDTVLIIDPARRGTSRVATLSAGDAAAYIRRSLPLPELPTLPALAQLPARLARSAAAYRVQLALNPRDLRDLLLTVMQGSTSKLTLSVFTTSRAKVA